MKFITDLFKPKNEINTLFEKACKKREKEESAASKKSTAYINKITRRVAWTRKKEELKTIPVIKFLLKIVKFFTPVKKKGPFSLPDEKITFTADEINALYSRTVKKMKADKAAELKKTTDYLDRITARVKASKNKKD